MAVRAHNVTFRYLGDKAFDRHLAFGGQVGNSGFFCLGVTVVKIHDIKRISDSAICTRGVLGIVVYFSENFAPFFSALHPTALFIPVLFSTALLAR